MAVPPLEHAALLYRGEDEFLDATVPFVVDGVRNGEPVFVALPTDNLTLLREALGVDMPGRLPESLVMADMTEVGRNPARAFGEFSLVTTQFTDQRIRWLAEPVWPGRDAAEYPGCVQNEALVNLAFADRDITTLCPYDAARLSDEVLADARRTHPLIQQGGTVADSPEFSDSEALAEYNTPLQSDPGAAVFDIAGLDDLGRARAFAAEYARGIALNGRGAGDLLLIITELATNSLKYTEGGCRLGLWQHRGGLVCEIRDTGHLDDPLAGRRAPELHATGGRGLFLVNAMADLVRTHTGPAGTTIQVHLGTAPSPEPIA